jgi:hypothetical protein
MSTLAAWLLAGQPNLGVHRGPPCPREQPPGNHHLDGGHSRPPGRRSAHRGDQPGDLDPGRRRQLPDQRVRMATHPPTGTATTQSAGHRRWLGDTAAGWQYIHAHPTLLKLFRNAMILSRPGLLLQGDTDRLRQVRNVDHKTVRQFDGIGRSSSHTASSALGAAKKQPLSLSAH